MNRYCDRLGIDVPDPESLVGRRDRLGSPIKLFQLMVVALLERGEPMSLDELVARLEAAGVWSEIGDLAHSLRKAWHGMSPIYRDAAGRLGLELDSPELDRLAFRLELRPPKVPKIGAPPLPTPRTDEQPLSQEEVDAAFRGRGLSSPSSIRQAAAVLDARGEPVALEDVEATLAELTPHRVSITEATLLQWRSSLVTLDAAGRLVLDRSHPDIPALRRDIRKRARPVLTQRAREEHFRRAQAVNAPLLEAKRAREAERVANQRPAVLRTFPEHGPPAAVTLLDVRERTIRTYLGADIDALPLAGYDLLIGLHIRDALAALGADADSWRLVDLRPPQKSRRVNKQGRTISITPEQLISATTGISRPLGDPSKLADYLQEGETGKLVRRLESDVKALYAYYAYGALHGFVRLRWGFLDERLGIDWGPRVFEGTSLHGRLERAMKEGTEIEVVHGSAPGWAEPWARARRVTVESLSYQDVTLRARADVWRVRLEDIQALRPVRSGTAA